MTLGFDNAGLSNLAGWVELPSGWRFDAISGGELRLEHSFEQWPDVEPLQRRLRARPTTPNLAWRISGHLQLTSLEVEIPGLADGPVRVPASRLDLDVLYATAAPRREDRLSIRRLDTTLPSNVRGQEVQVHLAAEARNILDGQRPIALAMRGWIDDAPCDAALGAIPPDMVPHLHEHLSAQGRFSPTVRASVDMRNAQTLKLDVSGLPGSCQLQDLGPYSPHTVTHDFVKDVSEGVSRPGLVQVGPLSKRYVRLRALPSWVSAAAWITEQANFKRNHGLAVRHIRNALRRNLEKGRFAYGGSIISQQLVKNLFLNRRKTLARKLEELLIVWRMQEILTPDRILELYLNCIEFGPDVYGIGNASWYYFGKHATALTPLEGSFLAALKPTPLDGMRWRNKGRTPWSGWWPDRLRNIMERLHRFGFINERQLASASPYVVRFRRGE